MSDLLQLIKIAELLDSTVDLDSTMAANVIDIAVNETVDANGDYLDCVDKIACFATSFDFNGQHKVANILDNVLLKSAESISELRAQKYDFKENNSGTLFRMLRNEEKLDPGSTDLNHLHGAMSLLTRYSPDYPGVALLRISDGVYQDTLSRKVYDFNRGFVSENGHKNPGGSVAHQTPLSSGYFGQNQVFESNFLRTRPR